MATGVWHEVALGYQLLWNTQRQVAGVALTLDTRPGSMLDTRRLLDGLGTLWEAGAPALLLRAASPTVSAELLDLTPHTLAQVDVPSAMLADPAIAQRVQSASERGLGLVWRGEPGQRLLPALAPCFSQSILSLSTEEALMALRASLRRLHDPEDRHGLRTGSPVRANHIYDGIASQALAEHCLDMQGATALLGWPAEDVLYSYRQTRIQPGHDNIERLLKAIDADASMDQIEHKLCEDPMLVYRFLRYTNSAALGLNHDIDSVRQGLLVLGLARTRNWLHELLPGATHDPNLQPVRQVMVLRARFMAELLEAGESTALKRELYLCGLLSQIDLLLGEPMHSGVRALPLPGRIKDALLAQEGPYWPYLDLAASIESPYPNAIPKHCVQHGFDLEDVNLALLRTLAQVQRHSLQSDS
jgi:EAL and modified HD-GYP domain-containing signal transduction protein